MKGIKKMNKTINIAVNQNLLSYIEGKLYEKNSRRDLLAYALSMNMDLNTDSFKQYQKELEDCSREYDIAVKNMLEDYLKPELKKQNIEVFQFNVNFEKGVAEISYEAEEKDG